MDKMNGAIISAQSRNLKSRIVDLVLRRPRGDFPGAEGLKVWMQNLGQEIDSKGAKISSQNTEKEGVRRLDFQPKDGEESAIHFSGPINNLFRCFRGPSRSRIVLTFGRVRMGQLDLRSGPEGNLKDETGHGQTPIAHDSPSFLTNFQNLIIGCLRFQGVGEDTFKIRSAESIGILVVEKALHPLYLEALEIGVLVLHPGARVNVTSCRIGLVLIMDASASGYVNFTRVELWAEDFFYPLSKWLTRRAVEFGKAASLDDWSNTKTARLGAATYRYLMDLPNLKGQTLSLESWWSFFRSRENRLNKAVYWLHGGYSRILRPLAFGLLSMLSIQLLGQSEGRELIPLSLNPYWLLKDYIFQNFFLEWHYRLIDWTKIVILLLEFFMVFCLFSAGLALKRVYGYKKPTTD